MNCKSGLTAVLLLVPFLAGCGSVGTSAAEELQPGAYEVTFSGSFANIPLPTGNGPGSGPWHICLTGSPRENPEKLVRGLLAEFDNGNGNAQVKRDGSHITGSTELTLDPDKIVGTAKFSFDGNILADGLAGDLAQHWDIKQSNDHDVASAVNLMNSTTMHLKAQFTGKCGAETRQSAQNSDDQSRELGEPAEEGAEQRARAAADSAPEPAEGSVDEGN
jgi:hypothetical protein